MKSSKFFIGIIALILVIVVAILTILFSGKKGSKVADNTSASCITKTEDRIVSGNSLDGFIDAGKTIKILYGFYDCNPVQRGDVVVYNYAGDVNPMIKIVKGVSGDKFHLSQTNGGWNILINGEVIKNSSGQEYLLSDRSSRMLALYENDYKGVIPAGAYLILGNLASGSLDSSRFGLVSKSDILGKVVY